MANLYKEKKRILLVEDEEDAKGLVAHSLPEYKLVCACDFSEGLRLARREYFDLYILDSWLPDQSGVELCRFIREFDPCTPILFYSAAAYARDIREAIRAGAQEYLVKPVIPDELRWAVAQLISVAYEKVFEARRAAVAAIQEELAVWRMENAERTERVKKKALRIKAEMAFLTAGGTRAAFAREWLSAFTEEVRSLRTSDMGNGPWQKVNESAFSS
jgi:DNA-binding response OmpR family regulator